jgi:hypothetical protein
MKKDITNKPDLIHFLRTFGVRPDKVVRAGVSAEHAVEIERRRTPRKRPKRRGHVPVPTNDDAD